MKQTYLEQVQELTENQKQLLASQLLSLHQDNKSLLTLCIKKQLNSALCTEQIKTFAQSNLPEQCIPQVIKIVEDMPRTTSGKIDRQTLPTYVWQEVATHKQSQEEPFIDNFVAPSNDIEQTLANIWSEVLGCGEISVNDNFLEVGGDSLLSIRILARINKAGLRIATEDFFEFPTIAEQAKVITSANKNSYDKGSTTGAFSLIPIQSWLFERIKIDPQQWNQTLLLSANEHLDVLSLERALQKLLAQHDALRSTFSKNSEGQWQQAFMPLNSILPLQIANISAKTEEQQNQQILHDIETVNQSMQLDSGQLFSVILFITDSGFDNKLALIAHHLIIDNESWRVVLEDLQHCWLNFANNQPIDLPEKTSSFKLWSEKLQQYASSNPLLAEQNYWQMQDANQSAKIPRDIVNDSQTNTAKTTQIFNQSFDLQTSNALLKDLPKTHKIEVRDSLICALICALNEWAESQSIVIDMEGHGREQLFEDVDISRTVGWFTSVFPVLFELVPSANIAEQLANIQQTIKDIPNKGIGHGIIKEYIADPKIKQQPHAEICFNYLGQTNDVLGGEKTLQIMQQNIGQPRSPNGLRAYLIEVNARIENEILIIDWFYSDNIHLQSSIQRLAQIFDNFLRDIIKAPHTQPTNVENDLQNSFGLDESELSSISDLLSQLENGDQ
ncbi:condensation domain-containing protein [uncultured Paraglaciecola sp.]|uniref:condensation domain-containing protein n=1 Tax=uncultured Paraglaciecola sp. TaxID=1765024 RepID=UPI0026244B7F|nr:condensation domain-containing protein [uncultured Paraglaciecola sp.]